MELRLLLKDSDPSVKKVQYDAVSIQWISQQFHRLRPFLSPLYAYFNNRKRFCHSWRQIDRCAVDI